eukprot:gene1773-2328_t
MEKVRINAAGYCNAGPVRPPYGAMPPNFTKYSEECGRRWATLSKDMATGARLKPGLRSIELGVTDLERSARFYTEVWGLERVAENAGRHYLRATGNRHHAVCLAQTDHARLEGVTLAARDASAIDALHAKANQSGGVRVLAAPHALPPSTGGGYGLALEGPEGLRINISSEVANVVLLTGDHSRPESLTHVVLNSRDV